MSLNGLDDPTVQAAHDAAVAEPGGWFLLKYATRDEVEIHDSGSGGIVEIRQAIAKYEDESPLFGFLRYRRRSVLIKYLPEGVSRLVQARLTVHFSAVTDTFAPQTIFEIESSKELKDGALSAACSLHTSSGSTSSSTSSLRQRILLEIAEEEEEQNRNTSATNALSTDEPIGEYHEDILDEASAADLPELLKADTYQSPESQTIPHPDQENLALVPTISLDPVSRPSAEYEPSRTSSNQDRASFAESTRSEHSTYTSYTPTGRQKVKLGPRPSLDSVTQGPSSSSATYRPVSSLPPGLKLYSRKSQKTKDRITPSAANRTLLSPTMEGVVSASQDTSGRPISAGRPNSSSAASIKSTLSNCTVTSRTSTASPDQTKLMKALEMRKRKMSMQSVHAETAANEAAVQSNAAIDPTQIPLPEGEDDISDELALIPSTAESDGTTHSSVPASPCDPAAAQQSTQASSVSDTTEQTMNDCGDEEPALTAVEGAQNSIETSSSGTAQEDTLINQDAQIIGNEPTEDKATTDPSNVEATILESHLPASAAIIVEPVKAVLQAVTDVIMPHALKDEEVIGPVSDGPQKQIIASSTPELQINGEINDEVSLLQAPPAPNPLTEAYPPSLDKGSQTDLDELMRAHQPRALGEVSQSQMNAPKKEMKMPLSKFSVQKENDPSQISNVDSAIQLDPGFTSPPKRKSLIAPIITNASINQRSRPNSSIDLLNDEDFMDELQSATVQEAKPVSLPKSPGRAMFPRDIKKSDSAADRISRTVSNPHELLGAQERPEPARSASASWLNRPNQNQQPSLKKSNLGGGIAQRIKALEKLSTSAGGPPGAQPSSAVSTGPSPTFFTVRKSNLPGSKTPSIAERANSLTRPMSSASVSQTRDSSPEQHFMGRGRSLSIKNQQDNLLTHTPTNLSGRSRPESRPYSARSLAAQAAENISSPDQRFSPPPTTDQQRALASEVARASQDRLSSPAKGHGRKKSLTAVKDLINDTRKSFSDRRRSTNMDSSANLSRSPERPELTQYSSNQSFNSHRSSQDHGNRSPSVLSDESPEKKASRASRMLNKISSSVSASRKTIAQAMSPTLREESEPSLNGDSQTPALPPPAGEATTVLQMGDVNVQFPDNLLWKRRAMCLDSHGYLILTQSQTGTDRNTGEKKYHLAEFMRPAIPDIDMEEMPNSVVLNFVAGSGLQLACADRQGQMWVLQRLQEAHANWTQ